MCDGGVVSVPLAMTILSTATAMYSQNQQQKTASKAATAQAEYNAQVAANEQATQQQLAQNEVAKGVAERDRLLRQASRQQGEATSMLAANGFALDSGSNLSLLAEGAEEAQYDANIVTQNANMAAWQHQVGATKAANDGSMFAYQKQQANSGNSLLAMGGTLLGGIAAGLGQYNQYKATAGKTASNQGMYANGGGTFNGTSGISYKPW